MSKLERPGRDDLIEHVKYGRMSPDEAEAEAARFGLERLASSPEPRKYNPMGEAWWTLPMTVAWIAWRDPLEVLRCYDPYRVQCLDWHYQEWRLGSDGPIHKGHFLKERHRATLSLLSLAERYDIATDVVSESSAGVLDAKAHLWKALQANLLQATGIPNDGEQRKPIPDYEWRDLQAIEERGRDVVRYDRLSATGYNEISLRRHSIMTLWPERRRSDPETEPRLPPTIRPDGPGYFPLYCASQWIATQGGVRKFIPTDTAIWNAAYSELAARIASGHVKVTGVRNGIREEIDGHIFASLRVDHPFVDTSFDLILSEELYLCSYPYVDDEHWHNGFDDSLQTRAGTQWSKLMVLKSDVAQFWSFVTDVKIQDSSPAFRTGAPGRPTPMHLVVAEHRNRLATGKAEMRVVAESERLAAWLKETHPHLPTLTSKTIRNKISAAHRMAGQRPK